ncbi:Interleukin-12 receptor subunit beta-1 [Chelonia mydas]|uniref:Interleukin-12 receptor subunit beta-1 n=1 Tax=Chelonia mydas TaxID=8469 RepID=M7AGM2_CHEMY|nr:Interleukin-12 receptor subunit beta-1 [Chelonia mydas]
MAWLLLLAALALSVLNTKQSPFIETGPPTASREPLGPSPPASQAENGGGSEYDGICPESPHNGIGPPKGRLIHRVLGTLKGSAEDPDLVCYRNCTQCNFICTWRAKPTSGNVTYTLKFCYHSTYPCKEFKTESSTHCSFSYRTLRVLQNLTAWVESHSGGRVERTQNITLQLENAIKLDPPLPHRITFSKSSGTLTLALQQLDTWTVRYEPLRREARYRQRNGTEWTQVECQTRGEYKRNNITEIPEVTYTVGRLGRNGQRNVTFHWQEAHEEQWKVNYTLAVYMPACRCTVLKKEVPEKDETTLILALSGAEYHVSVSASNPAGRGPVQTYRIPPEHRTEMNFLNVTSDGSNVTVQWAAKTNGTFYCFEKQPLEEPQEDQEECIHKQFFEKDSDVNTGTVKPRKCYRIAIHGGGPEKHWTFGSMYLFATNTSFDGPIHIKNTTANSAFLLWKPSPLSQCPGILKKYIICYTSEQDNRTAWGSKTELCFFLGPNPAEWKLNLRAKKVLFPPLPNPMDSEAIKFPAEEMSQVKPRPGFVEPSEKVSGTEPLVTEFMSDKGEPDLNTETHSLHLYTQTEETAGMLQAKEGQAGSENDLPFEYRRQVLLTPAEEEQEEDDFREFASVCGQNNLAEAGTGPSQPHPEEGAAMEPTGLSRPLVQLSLLLSDKPVIIKNGGSFDLLHDK